MCKHKLMRWCLGKQVFILKIITKGRMRTESKKTQLKNHIKCENTYRHSHCVSSPADIVYKNKGTREHKHIVSQGIHKSLVLS